MDVPNSPIRSDAPEELHGIIERVTFHSSDTGFAVLQVRVRGQKDLISVLGNLPEVTAGEWIDARGRWIIDQQYGRQFRSLELRTTIPSSAEGIKKYMASGLIKGIGPALAGRLVDAFDKEVFDVIEKTPHRLLEVDGIGEGRRARIVSAWEDQKKVREIMVFLHTHGVSASRAFRIYKEYGDDAIAKVREDPYRLARDIWGIGFKTADQIAASIGIDKHSDLRARAGVEFVLQELTNSGHCAFPREQLARKAQEMLQVPGEIIDAAISYGIAEGRLVEDDDLTGEPLVYLSGFRWAEQRLAEHLISLTKGPHPCTLADLDPTVAQVQQKLNLVLAPSQREAISLAFKSKVMVITGGPGVGKTTLVNAIVQVFKAQGLNIQLGAPTGRAAKRLCETTGQDAKTIHRLLEFDPSIVGFKRCQEYPLEGDVFILDEVSMVDLMLAYQFVRAVPPNAALILVGDVDQLPSVGAGSILRDIIDSGVIATCRLTEVFRQAAHSNIVANAHRVNHGQLPFYPVGRVANVQSTDFYLFPAEDPQEAIHTLQRLVTQAIPQNFGFNSFEEIQVLTPTQRGELGARNLNSVLQLALNHNTASIERFGWRYRIGDKVMQTVNDYDKDIFNGDIGRVMHIDETEQELTVRYDDRCVSYDFNELDELQPAFAVTIHKSQGSEYPAVVVPIHMQHYTMLQRNLLYTAITRGRKLVVLVGSRRAIAMAVNRRDSTRRITTLKQRLLEARSQPGPSGG